MDLNFVFPVVVAVLVLGGSFGIGYYQTKKTGENLARLAEQLHLELSSTGKFFKKHRLAGEFRGRPGEIYNYTTGAGKSRQTWSAVAVTVKKTGGLTFSLERRVPFFDMFTGAFRKNEVKTGDVLFDKGWVLKSNQPEFMQAALLPEIRERLMGLAKNNDNAPNIKLEIYRIVYSERGAFSSGKTCERTVHAVDVVSDLAEIVEVGAEMKNPPA